MRVPLREKGRAANISSANSSLVRSLPSDLTQSRSLSNSDWEYSSIDLRVGMGGRAEALTAFSCLLGDCSLRV